MIAGPCSAETPEQLLVTARALADKGIGIFRAGVWKPRTKPGGFEGVGAEALAWLQEVRRQTGMRVATEVATPQHAVQALAAGIDILWIGARTSTDPFAVDQIASSIAGSGVEVYVKNPPFPDVEAWIGAIERIERAGIVSISAVCRGFRAYGDILYRNRPQWPVAIELKRRRRDLPVLVDPSHIAGRRDLVETISQQALDMRFDGLMIESHCDPDSAWSDAAQQLTPDDLGQMLSRLVVRDNSVVSDELSSLRAEIDMADEELLELLARRMGIARRIGLYKKTHDMTVVQPDRYGRLLKAALEKAEEKGLNPETVSKVMYALHEESVEQQLKIINGRK